MTEQEFRESFPSAVEQNLIWGDMDAFGHLNNVAYFRLFESARIAYFEKVGALEFMRTEGIGPILHSTNCRYRLPLTYPDKLLIGAKVSWVGSDRYNMEHGVYSLEHQALAANGEGLLVCVKYPEGGKAPVPQALLQHILEFQKECPPEMR